MSSPGPTSDGTWISDEPRLGSVAGWLLSRARRRRALVLSIALVAASGVVALRALKGPMYRATLYYRLTEGDLANTGHVAHPPRNIRQYIANVALSRGRLERIMQEYGISRAWLARDRAAAIEEFREGIDVAVERNYFIYPRSPGEAPRTAHVAISLTGPDEEQTRAILREIGEAIPQVQAQERRHLGEVNELFRGQLAQIRAQTGALQAEIERLTREAARADRISAIPIEARIAALKVEAAAAIERELTLERRASAVAFGAAADEERLGTNLELIDEGVTPIARPLTAAELALWAAIVFALALLPTAIVVGAFDDLVYAPRDLAAWGLPLFGALPRFPGDDAGSYRARTPAGRA